MTFRVTWKMQLLCCIFSSALAIMQYTNIFKVMDIFKEMCDRIFLIGNNIVNFFILQFILVLLVSVLHEVIHGITYKIFGGKIKYGFRGIYAYVQEVSGMALRRTSFLIILISPIIIISFISIIISKYFGGIIFWINLLGSTGDLYMAFYLCKTNYYNRIVDKIYGFDVI